MKLPALCASLVLALAAFGGVVAPPARANTFCPVTIAALTSLAIVGKSDTYGVLLDLDPSDVASARLRVDSTTTRYAVDLNDLGPVGAAPAQARRYFTIAPGESVNSAWIESTGTTPEDRLECPVTRPYAASAPAPIDPRVVATQRAGVQTLRDSFSTKTVVIAARSFGPVTAPSCAQPFAPARSLADIAPPPPPGAKLVHANGITIVRVDLDETNAVVRTQLVRSSGFAPLDAVALAAAQNAKYQTQIFACRPIATSLQYTISFAGN